MRFFRFLVLVLAAGFSLAFAQKPYFQQEVNYRIAVSLDDVHHMIRGTTEFDYYNNSPDTLRFLYLHLWPNAYSSPKTAWARQQAESGKLDFLDAPDSSRGWIDSLAFRLRHWETRELEADTLKLEQDPANPDIAKLYLPHPLAPGEVLALHTPFRVKIPADFSRMGHVGQGYQITQWFPKPAVYDNTGWHQMPYLDQGEFYSEFGRFDVDITVPRNYRVAATGILENQREQQWLDSLAERGRNKQWTGSDLFPPSDPQTKTLHYSQTDVHDFGWFADKRYNVMKSKVALPNSKKNREVTTWTFFLNKHANRWQKAVAYVDSAVYYYSLWSGEYPYTAATAVEGALKAGGGMEYPMITVISDNGTDFSLDNVITHEVGHNWFYGILGTNERDFVWMDESVNTFFQDRIMMKKYPKATLGDGLGINNNFLSLLDAKDLPYSRMNELAGTISSRSNLQQPLETPSADFTSFNYGALAYLKGAYLFRYLMFYLGEETFDKAMRDYYTKCAFSHPGPADMKKAFEESTGQDLTWFFHALLRTRDLSDYALTLVQQTPDGWNLRVANREKLVIPFSISAVKGDSVVRTEWFQGFEGARMLTFPKVDCDRFVLDYLRVSPEISRDNNTVRTHGALRTVESLQIRLGTGVENDRKNSLYVLPAIGWNSYNGFMAGVMLHNLSIPARKFSYYAMPMYAFGSKGLSGAAGVKYDLQPASGVQRIRFEINAVRFGGWQKLAPRVSLRLMPKDLRRSASNAFYLEGHLIFLGNSIAGAQMYRFVRAGYVLEKKGKLHSYTLHAWYMNRINLPQDPIVSDIQRFAQVEFTDRLRLAKKTYLTTRASVLAFRNNTFLGGQDLLMEQYNVGGRFGPSTPTLPSELGQRQRFTTFGGTYSAPYQSINTSTNGWPIGSDGFGFLQATIDIPKVPFLDVWAEGAAVLFNNDFTATDSQGNAIPTYDNKVGLYYGAGVTLALGKALQVHFPLAGMAYAKGIPQNFSQAGDAVRFTLTLNPFQRPFDLPEVFLK